MLPQEDATDEEDPQITDEMIREEEALMKETEEDEQKIKKAAEVSILPVFALTFALNKRCAKLVPRNKNFSLPIALEIQTYLFIKF